MNSTLSLGPVLSFLMLTGICIGQTSSAPPYTASASPNTQLSTELSARPLPDIPTLMQQVEEQEHRAETLEKDYLYRETAREERGDGHGNVKKSETREFDVFSVEGVEIRRLISKDGVPLSPDEQKKQSQKIDKEVAEAKDRRAKAGDKETDSRGHEVVTWSRMLELGTFTNARREQVDGRDTIAVDFAGNPKAKTHSQLESAIHELAGTVWVDEADKSIVRVDGHFANPYKIGGGLLINVSKGTQFTFKMRKVNDEVWLPESLDAHGQARLMLFASFDGGIQVSYGNYRKFKATSTILPGVNQVDEPKTPNPPDDDVR